jgi:hypothetical protein
VKMIEDVSKYWTSVMTDVTLVWPVGKIVSTDPKILTQATTLTAS